MPGDTQVFWCRCPYAVHFPMCCCELTACVWRSYYKCEIAAYNVRTKRCDLYGQNPGVTKRCFLVYDGLHYDAMALAASANASERNDITLADIDSPDLAKVRHPPHSYHGDRAISSLCMHVSWRLASRLARNIRRLAVHNRVVCCRWWMGRKGLWASSMTLASSRILPTSHFDVACVGRG